MTADECIAVEVYAEQYGVQSEKRFYGICYYDIVQGIVCTCFGHPMITNMLHLDHVIS